MKTPDISRAVFAAALLLAGCTTPPIAERIDANPRTYSRLGGTEQALVQRGEVERGMSKDGVYLAWGAPDFRDTVTWRNKRVETWCYNGYLPVAGPTRTAFDFGAGRHGDFFNERFFIDETPGNYVFHQTRRADFINDSLAGWAVTR